MSYTIAFLDGILQTQCAIFCRSLPVSHERNPKGVFSLEDCSNIVPTSEVCHPRCMFKLQEGVNFRQKHNYNMAKMMVFIAE